MIRAWSDLIENSGIMFFEWINRRKTSSSMFEDCCELNAEILKSMYADIKVFNFCEAYSARENIFSGSNSEYEINTYRVLSKYTPLGNFQKTYDMFPENKSIYYEEIRKSNSSSKDICVVYLHGFSERSYENEIKHLFYKLIYKIPNMEVLAVHLPYHMKRSPEGQPYSGAYLFDSFPIATIEGIRQSVHDVSQILSYAKDTYRKVIVGGFSLGGHITALLGTCDDRADMYIMGQAGAMLPESLRYLSVCPGLMSKSKKWAQEGIDFEQLYEPIELLKYRSIIPSEKAVSVAGIHDKLITIERVKKLRQFFNCRHCIDYGAGHIGLLLEYEKVKKRLIEIINET